MSSVLFPTSTRAFYGLNFLKDVQTAKLNAQLDVKERPPLNIYRRACARFFFRAFVSPEREPELNVALNVE